MEAKHTPGPWRIAHNCNAPDGGVNKVCDARGMGVATASIRFDARKDPMRRDETAGQYAARASAPGEQAANARLIAAAPDLLEALRELVEAVEDNDRDSLRELIAAHAAIAKALPPNAL